MLFTLSDNNVYIAASCQCLFSASVVGCVYNQGESGNSPSPGSGVFGALGPFYPELIVKRVSGNGLEWPALRLSLISVFWK